MERLRKLRRDRNLTQQQMAETLGVQRSTYTKYESGAISPNKDVLKELAEFFSVTVDYLLGGQNHKDPEPVYTQDDEEFWELREKLRRDPGMRTMFSLTKDATTEDMKKMIALLKAYKGDYDDE